MKNIKQPVILEGNKICCRAFFDEAFNEVCPEDKNGSRSYADLFCEGVKKYWGEAGFDVNIIRVGKKDPRPHIKILPARITSTSYVCSPWWRWGWGLLTHGMHPEAFMLNWSLNHPGNIHMNLRVNYPPSTFMRVSAHEFGHVLGLGDAYGAHYRFFYEAPGTRDFMMNCNKRVSGEEARMVKRARETSRMQYFPMRFSLKRYLKGLLRKIH